MNGTHTLLKTAAMIEGPVQFQREYSDRLWLAVSILPGLNDTVAELTSRKSRNFSCNLLACV
jgi:hypothetical protein